MRPVSFGRLGPHCSYGTASFLEAYGYSAFAPALGDEKTHDLQAG